jgi:hypothetical protein
MRRPAVLLLACLMATGVLFSRGVGISGGRVLGAGGHARFTDDLTVEGTGTVTFSAVVHPHGRATTAFFEFGLASRYREPRPPGIVYDRSSPRVHLAAGSQVNSVSGRVSGLVPNALYHLRLVATSRAGTVYSPDATFTTAKDPPPPLPRFGATVNVAPVSALVLIRAGSLRSTRASQAASLIAGKDFLPLTENRQAPIAAQIDARAGALRLVVAGAQRPLTQEATLSGGLFSLSQTPQGVGVGLTTVSLLEGIVPDSATYDSCPAPGTAPASDGQAPTALSSSAVLQTLNARDQDGSFATRGRYSITTVSAAGTVWDTVDRCDGTLTIVRRGTVTVTDLRLGTTNVVPAGQQYLAQAA